jgi:hypothetical protein
MTPRRFCNTLIVLCLLALPALAKAHYLWIESEAREARVYFGEFNEGLREKAGGRLDERAALRAWLEPPTGPRRPLKLTKKNDHFAASSEQDSGWLVAEDLTSEVKDYRKQEIGIVKPMFYARAALGNAAPPERPSLELDLLPVPAQPGVFRVFFAGKPLAGAKVFVYAPNLWMRELVSDEQGQVTAPAPWPGRYVLDVTHKDGKPGEYRGQQYASARHRMTFSFVSARQP